MPTFAFELTYEEIQDFLDRNNVILSIHSIKHIMDELLNNNERVSFTLDDFSNYNEFWDYDTFSCWFNFNYKAGDKFKIDIVEGNYGDFNSILVKRL